MNLVRRLVFAIVSGLALVASVYLRMEALAVVALITLGVAVLQPEIVQDLTERLRKAGPFEFEATVRKALEAVPESDRPRAEQEARETIERLGKDITNVSRFANSVRTEVAVLGVRVTAVEELLNALRTQVAQHLRQHPPSPPTGG